MKILRALLALALLLTPMRALAQEAKALTADCVITSGKVKTAAAHDGDYTTAWRSERVRRPYLEFELPEGKALMQKWGVDARYAGVGHCILGYAAAEPAPAKARKADFIVRV